MRIHPFRPRLLDTLKGYDRATFTADATAGLTVGIVALPLAMAFAIASGVKPEQGLFTAIVGGLIVAALGGSNVQIAGPAGAFIVIVYGIVERYGLTNLLISTALAGVLLFAFGLLRLGALVRYIPVTIIIGFTNGIAVLIALSQVKDLLGLQVNKMPADFFAQVQTLWQHLGSLNPWALAIGLGCLAVVVVWPKSYTMPQATEGPLPTGQRLRRAAAHLPGTIVALGLATLATVVLALPVETIGSRFGGIPQGLPQLALPAFDWASAKQLLIPTVTIAMLGAIESLLCARVADNLIDAPRHDPNQELMAQGVANMVSPLFGGIPVTGTIARTVTNVRSGARTPVSGIVHALALLLVVLFAAPLAEDVPLAALAGILLFVAWNMGEWREFARLRRFSLAYRITLVGTFVLTVVFDLTVAVEAGLVMACVFFIYRMSTLFRVEADTAASPPGVLLLRLHGALFFGAVSKVETATDPLPPGLHTVVLDLNRLMLIDSSGLDALAQLRRALQRQGVRLIVCELRDQPRQLFERSGFADELGEGPLQATVGDALAVATARGQQAPASALKPG